MKWFVLMVLKYALLPVGIDLVQLNANLFVGRVGERKAGCVIGSLLRGSNLPCTV